MKDKFQSHEDLLIWQCGMDICYQIYDLLENCRDFRLRDQLQSSAVSIPSNIAEGFELSSNRAFIRHLFIAKGSAAEFRTQVLIAIARNYIPESRGTAILLQTKKLGGMIYEFIQARREFEKAIPNKA